MVMRMYGLSLLVSAVMACSGNDVSVDGDGSVTVVINECTSESAVPLYDGSDGGGGDPPGVIATCDDHLPCTVDVQCTPCSAVPEEIRVKATCTADEDLSAFCFVGEDVATRVLAYTGCTHFIQDPTPPGVKNACFPVAYADGEPHPGVCNQFGVCVENPP